MSTTRTLGVGVLLSLAVFGGTARPTSALTPIPKLRHPVERPLQPLHLRQMSGWTERSYGARMATFCDLDTHNLIYEVDTDEGDVAIAVVAGGCDVGL